MKQLHARYPFLATSRQAVQEAGIDLAELVAREDDPIVERAVARVEGALTEGDVGEQSRSARDELLSYPVARVLVSLVDVHICTRRYARAEAAGAHERFVEEFEDRTELKSTQTERLSFDQLLAEFDLTSHIHEDGASYRVDVATYLLLAADMWGDEWRLVNRELTEGQVPVTQAECYDLLRQAIQHRIEDGLPLNVPDAIAESLTDEVEHLEEVISELDLTREIDTVVPDLFPPCMTALLDKIQKGEHLEHHSRFAITAFLASIGMNTDEIVSLYEVNPGFGEDITRYQTDHIRGATSPTEYSAPSCATMQSYGDCVNKDDRCETISHPMAYYEKALDDADDDELTDWRTEQAEAEEEEA
ncbi:DNA primase regulatory subunit PriL [Haladaptatus sp. DJG-WS-42]|uniref:DNA primase regulatory subunit PriL n=1 Tax=Haladaptatus sp. DJG-WS-42 TaxID=3120516 RepID=UPI0030D30D6E